MGYVFSRGEIAAVRQYWPFITQNAGGASVTPFVLVGLGSRESNWGLGLQPQGPAGTGDFAHRPPHPNLARGGSRPPDGLGFGRGLLQLDWDAQPFARQGNWQDPAANIAEGCQVLAQCRAYFQMHMPSLGGVSLLRASLAAYNHGPGAVFQMVKLNGITAVDVGTTGNNYSMDVLDRASSFENLHLLGGPDNGTGGDTGGDGPPPADLFQEVASEAAVSGFEWPAED